ncbi:MAG: uroporphyrinogen decarboxylase family protein [Desulfosarcinaceae bacterium]|nr:uroporphyrinogen decarboxylase family protein [Desulfosarcinaceae bacterium]
MEYDAAANDERIQQAIALEVPDQVPVFLHTTGPFMAGHADTDLYDYFHRPELMTKAQNYMHQRFSGLSQFMPDLGSAPEAAGMGAPITFTDDGVPWVGECVETEADLEKLTVADVEKAGYMTRMLHNYRYMRGQVPFDVPVYFYSVMSPWANAALLRGVSHLMMDVIANPDFVHKLVRRCTELEIQWLKTMQSEVPPKYFDRILLNDDIASFVSLEQFREFILPAYQEVYNAFPDCQRWYHNDGNATAILEGIAEAGIQCFHFGYQVDPVHIKKTIGDRVCLMGSIPPLQVLREGTPEEVDRAVKSIIHLIGRDGGLIVAAGGYISEGTPLANLDAMIRACEKYGRRDQLGSLSADPWPQSYRIKEAKKADGAETPSTAPESDPEELSPNLQKLQEILIAGDFDAVKPVVQQAVADEVDPRWMLQEVMIPALEEVGRRFSAGTIFIPEMLMSAQAMQAGLAVLEPVLAGAADVQSSGKFAIGTVKGDLHDIGKNIVITMMQGAGFEVVDLGVDCPPEKFIEAVENGADLIGMSAILTTTLKSMDIVIRTLEEKGLREKVKILVGGASVTERFANEIGADAYCDDAGEGVFKAKAFMEEKVAS